MFFATFKEINYLPCEKGFFTDTRVFDFPYILYVHEGKGKFIIGKRTYHCKTGDLLFCPVGKPNTIIADGNNPFILSGIDFTINDNDYLNAHMLEYYNISSNMLLKTCIEKMIRAYLYNESFSSSICNHLLTAILYELFLLKSDKKENYNKNSDKAVIDYIEQNIESKITLSLLSDKFHYHRNTIANIVKKVTGHNLNDYVTNLRIKEIQNNLLFTEDSVEKIAQRMGYSTTSYLCVQYKQKTGETPTQFRQRCREL